MQPIKCFLFIMTTGGIMYVVYCILQLSTVGSSQPKPYAIRSQFLAIYVNSGSNSDKCVIADNISEHTSTAFLTKHLPKCLIIGFAKCGTYALKSFLSLHPDIVSPNHEVAYFTKNYHKGLQWYRRQMPMSLESQITIEKTPGYILSLDALSRIHSFNASIKLIVAVRDPLVRMLSSYAHAQATGKLLNETLASWLQAKGTIARIADYARHLKNVFLFFPASQVLVVQEEELEDKPLTVLRDVETFLGVCHALTGDLLVFNPDKGFYCFNMSSHRYQQLQHTLTLNHKNGCFSRSKGRTHPHIQPQLLDHLVAKVGPYNEQLYELLGRRFNWTHAASSQ